MTVITVDDVTRWDPLVESAAYFVVAESLTNTLKYARATSATVRVAPREDVLVIEVTDDGCGGASPADGSGLGGLRDRVEALDGTFDVHSPRGAGHADPRRAASRDRSLSPAPRPQTVPA